MMWEHTPPTTMGPNDRIYYDAKRDSMRLVASNAWPAPKPREVRWQMFDEKGYLWVPDWMRSRVVNNGEPSNVS
jgi:hypothetical protein